MLAINSRGAVQRGFTLIEILIAIVVVGVGLIGLAKLQAVSVGESTTADVRALIAIQGNSLSAAMHSNINFWGTRAINASFNGATVTDGATGLSAVPSGNCYTTSPVVNTQVCTNNQVAARDFQAFALALSKLAPVTSGTVVCTMTTAASTTNPTALYLCTVTVNWSEKSTATNASLASNIGTASVTSQSYQFMVQP